MQPYFATSADHSYAKSTQIYWQIIKNLENKTRKNDYEQYIQLYERFKQGYQVLRVNRVNDFWEDLP